MTRSTGRLSGILGRGAQTADAATPSQGQSPNAIAGAVEKPRGVVLAIQAVNDHQSRPVPTRAELRAAFLAGGNAAFRPSRPA